jgi:hypothetical protein
MPSRRNSACIRHQAVERAPVDLARDHVVHQSREIVGQCQRRFRAAGDEWCLAGIVGADLLRPQGDQLRQQQTALQPVHCRRDFQRGKAGGSCLRERKLVFVDVAERDDARQHRGVGLHLVEKNLSRNAAGAPGRQIERGPCEPFRIFACRKTFDQFAVEQRCDHRAQERN